MTEATEYLRRIGHAGPVRADSDTLAALHRAHLATVPYENLGIQLGRVPALTRDALFRRVVEERHGGFCFELNGAFGLLLRELGFSVRLVRAAVNRLRDGESAWGNHLALLVGTERGPMLADVGFGDGFLAPAGDTRELTDVDEFAAVLADEFGLPPLPPADLATLWRRAGEQQAAWNAAQRFRPSELR
ncbi:arylamine N-acetyltransferase family protein [Actinocatenispora sera]|uniref:Arylamine N-acetyltransferase n=1 Tax=Actinocatenispora sera TaxID=390989 RepID=A0A810L0Q3_9ACTN|nr:arylamine N-acetyltransferase [Actinocatenispora sera]BCJ27808.1 hypothetical protein Asera_19160 [Actinocatenispora sera]